ncbi:MAG: hypothetical protein IJW26_06040 [Clostridia bacterium]|nr:hypothetical protein [Clostridia bacterium]
MRKGLKIFWIVVGAVVLLAMSKPAMENVTGLFNKDSDTTIEQEDTENTGDETAAYEYYLA